MNSIVANHLMSNTGNTGDKVLAALTPFGLVQERVGHWRCNSPFRLGSDSMGFCVTVEDDGEHGAYYDHVSGERGSLYDLAQRLNLALPERIPVAETKRAYRDIDDYAQSQGVPTEAFKKAGVAQTLYKARPALAFPTKTGIVYRYIDGKSSKSNGKPDSWVNPPSYQRCWYGLDRAVREANSTGHPLTLCNGITSVIVAQYYGVPAACLTGGEPKEIPETLVKELQDCYTGPILLAPDNDKSGRDMVFSSSTKPGLLKQLRDVGYQVRALDLGLGQKGDLANYCSLHEDNSIQRLLKLSDLKPLRKEINHSGAETDKTTHLDLGNILIKQWNDDVAYFREAWYRYREGWWRRSEHDIGLDIWHIMQAHKDSVIPNATAKNSIWNYLEDALHVPDEKIDQGDSYINLRNGLYNLETDLLESHRRDLYLTSRLDFDYDSHAEAPHWKQFLSEVLVTPEGQHDSELADLVQEAMGLSLTTDVSYQVSFWLVGQPASGKSTLIKVIQALMGSSYVVLDPSTLDRDQYNLANVPGKRVIVSTENATNSILTDNIYKQLVSGDEMTARQIRKAPFSFRSQAKIWWAMNETPRNLDRTGAVDRRVLIIPFNRTVPETDRDPRLFSSLVEELPGIFNWALLGLRRLRANRNFTASSQVKAAKAEYRLENDTEQAFVNDWCIINRDEEVSATDLYRAYKAWCQRNGHRPKAKKR